MIAVFFFDCLYHVVLSLGLFSPVHVLLSFSSVCALRRAIRSVGRDSPGRISAQHQGDDICSTYDHQCLGHTLLQSSYRRAFK